MPSCGSWFSCKHETPMQMMRSRGDGHLMENTQQKAHIVFNSLAAPERHYSTQFGRLKPNPNAGFSHGSYSKKRSWQQTIWRKGAGHKTRCANFAIANQKRRHNYAKITFFTRASWDRLISWLQVESLPPSTTATTLKGRWKKCRACFDKHNKPFFDGIIIYFWWNIWEERNRRTFNHVSKSVEEVAFLAKEDFQQFSLAFSFTNTMASD